MFLLGLSKIDQPKYLMVKHNYFIELKLILQEYEADK